MNQLEHVKQNLKFIRKQNSLLTFMLSTKKNICILFADNHFTLLNFKKNYKIVKKSDGTTIYKSDGYHRYKYDKLFLCISRFNFTIDEFCKRIEERKLYEQKKILERM